VDIPIRTVGEYLNRWGFSPQKPITKAYEQQPEAVQKWLDESYPNIAKRAKSESADIHWGDETALVNTDVRGRGYEPKGRIPIRFSSGGTRQKLSMISTVTNQGMVRWQIIDDSYNADNLIIFLELLLKDASRKIFLIWDNLRAHHSLKVKAWVAEHAAQIELFYLPAYSPELNPDERLNADLKYGVGSKVAVRTKESLNKAAKNHMEMLSENPERIKSYFRDKRTQYAA
jgi:transposase